MNSMVEILACLSARRPEALFASDYMGNEYTYLKAWEAVRRVSYYLSEHENIQKGDTVLVECNQDVPYLIVDFACELIGAVFVPIEFNASDDKLKEIARETEAQILISRTHRLDNLNNLLFETVLNERKMLKEYSFPSGDSVAEILYTTGTTGKSKGIVITHAANVALAENIKNGVEMKDGNVEFIPIPISHSHGIRCCYANLLNEGSIVLADGLLNVKRAFQLMDKYHVSAMDISPSAAQLLIKVSKGAFWQYGRKMDYIQIGTAALTEALKKQLMDELPETRLYNFYGSTESGRSCVLEFSKEIDKDNCIGKPTKNAEIIFTDEERNPIEASRERPGLLASKGKMNMVGYWKNPKLSAEIMGKGYVYTNDLGYADKDGYIYIIGRKDDVINYNGIKIAPEEIEQIAIRYPGITDVACVPYPDENAGQVPRLFICIDENKKQFDDKLYYEYLQKHIDGNKMPKRIDIIDSIPRTSNGKIRRRDLVNIK